MRHTATVTSMSWIPSDSLRGALKTGMDLRLSHWDKPLPDTLSGPDELHELCRHDKFRFANLLSVWAEVEDGRVVDAGLDPGSGLVMGATTVRVGKIGATFRAAPLPVLRSEPAHEDGAVRFVQTVGGRTGVAVAAPGPAPAVRPLAGAAGVDHPGRHAAAGRLQRGRARGCERLPPPLGLRPRRAGHPEERARRPGTLDGALLRGTHPVGGPRPAGAGGRRGERGGAPAVRRHHARWRPPRGPQPARGCRAHPPRSAGGRALPRARRHRPGRRRRQRRLPSSVPEQSSASAPCSRAASAPRRSPPSPRCGWPWRRRRPSTSTASAPSPSRTTARTSSRPTRSAEGLSPGVSTMRARLRRWLEMSCSWRLRSGWSSGEVACVQVPSASRSQPCGALVEGEVEDTGDLVDLGRRGQLDEDLDPAVEVAVHQVCRPDPGVRLAAVLEPHDPAVLEVAAEDRAHPDRLGEPGHARPHGADAADEQLDGYAGAGGLVELRR